MMAAGSVDSCPRREKPSFSSSEKSRLSSKVRAWSASTVARDTATFRKAWKSGTGSNENASEPSGFSTERGRDMKGRWISTTRALTLAALLALPADALAESGNGAFTQSFALQDCEWADTGGNPYFILEPGRRLVYEGEDEGVQQRVIITVLHDTRPVTLNIAGEPRTVVTRIVEEREFEDGTLVERSRNFFAICAPTNDVFYFGETVNIYEPGEPISHEGAWLAGRDGAQPGIIMPGRFLLGARYHQERAAGIAMDRAEHTRMGLTVDTPLGTFKGCVEVVETSPLEPGAESIKLYCRGIGLVVDNTVRLVEITSVP